MSTRLNIFILLFGGLQGLLLWWFLCSKKLYQSGYIFLLLYLGVMLLQLTLKVMNKLWLMDNLALLYSLSHYLPLLYGPMVYLFVKDIVERWQFNPKVFLHFVPFTFILMITYLVESGGVSAFKNSLYNAHTRLIILFASLLTYHLLALRKWQQHRLSLRGYSDNSRFQMNWLKNFVLMSFVICGMVAVALYLLYINYPSAHQYRYGFAGLTIFIYWISYNAINQPAIFAVIRGNPLVSKHHISTLIIQRPLKKYASSTLEAKEKDRICEALEVIFKRDKIYLDTALNIDMLAEKVACSRHILSQVLNECMQQSFYDYINHFRVAEAKTLLLSVSGKDHKIASVAYDSGFNSLSTFNDVFKKITGSTPSQFKNRYLLLNKKAGIVPDLSNRK